MRTKRSTTQLPDDIKSSILAEMTTAPLKEHLVLDAAVLRNYEGVREEIQCYKEKSEPIVMDVTPSRRVSTANEQVPK